MAGSQAGLPQQVPSIVDSLKYCLPACMPRTTGPDYGDDTFAICDYIDYMHGIYYI
jgi:hypothetical protein